MNETEQQEVLQRIKELADSVIERFGPLSEMDDFGFNRDSVAWVEGLIERERERRGVTDTMEEVPEGLVNTFGAFLGESLIMATGGSWEWSERQSDWGVTFTAGGGAFPFTKVWKQFKNGLVGGDSILSFYEVAVDYIATGKLGSK